MGYQQPDVGRPDEEHGHTATTAEEAMAEAGAEGAGTTGEQAYAPHPGPDDPRRSGDADAPTDVGRDARPDSTPPRDRMAAETP